MEVCRAIAAYTGADVCLGVSTMGAVSRGVQTVYAQFAGYDDGLEAVHHPSSVLGRMFTAREYGGERVALLDETLAGAAERGGGDFINCGGRRYCIVGVVAGMPAQSASLGSGMLLLPLQTWQDAYALAPTELALAVPKGEKAGELAEDVLAKLHNLPGKISLRDAGKMRVDAAKSVVRIFRDGAGVRGVCVRRDRRHRRDERAVDFRTGSGGVKSDCSRQLAQRRGRVALLFLLEAAAYAALGRLLGILLGLGDDGALRRADWLDAAGEAAAHGTAAGGCSGAGAELRRDSAAKSGRTSSSAGT